MEPKFRTSFIPKKALATASNLTKMKSDGSLSGVTLIALVITLSVVVLSVGVFLYQEILESSISRKSNTLERAQVAFEPSLIQELARIDLRIKEVEKILNQHITPSVFFDSLEGITLKSVQFLDFSLTRVSDDVISISMDGVANDFRGVALQADIFGRSKFIREPIFSNLDIDKNGKAVFSLSAFIDPSFINFVNRIDGIGINN